LVLANVVTEGMFNAGLKDFVFGTREGKYVVGIDGGARLTLPELLGVGKNVPVGGTAELMAQKRVTLTSKKL